MKTFIAAALTVFLACGGDDPAPQPAPEPQPDPTSNPPPSNPPPSSPPPSNPTSTPPPSTPPPSNPPTSNPPPSNPTFAGTFSGSQRDVTACGAAPGVRTETYNQTWTISQTGRTANVTFAANCPPPFVADVEQDRIVAHLREKVCPPIPSGGTIVWNTLAGGTLTLSDDTLDATTLWLYEQFDVVTGARLEYCETVSSMRLARTAR